MLAARVEPKNGPKENKKTGNFKPVVFDEYRAGVDKNSEVIFCAAGVLSATDARPLEISAERSNNVFVIGDLTRRTLICHLDRGMAPLHAVLRSMTSSSSTTLWSRLQLLQ
jgi:hypothetical protein